MKTYLSPKPVFSVRVKVPATSANLGAGFDSLGLSLDHYNEVELTGWNDPLAPPVTIQVDGEGASRLPLDKNNLVYRMARKTIDIIGHRVPSLRVKLMNRIPLSRGLGSSSAAIVGGILAANAGCGYSLSNDEMLKIALEEEGHPDNIVPALLGGLCSAVVTNGRVHYVCWKSPRSFAGLRAVVCVPYFEVSTKEARAILPVRVDHKDAVFNSSRVALFLGALQQRRHDLLTVAMEDRLHQPYRRKLVPGLDDVIAAAKRAGAWGAALSGAGPTVMALAPAASAEKIGEAMSDVFRKRSVSAVSLNLTPGGRGAYVVGGNHKKSGRKHK